LGGRAEGLRLAFHCAGIAFKDTRLSREEFQADKQAGKFKFGQIPVLCIDGKQYAQSKAILHYICNLGGISSTDPIKELASDELLDANEDMIQIIAPTFREADAEKKLQMRKDLTPKVLDLVKILESIYNQTPGPFFLGNELSPCDFFLGTTFKWFSLESLAGFPEDVISRFPGLAAFQTAFAQHPKIAEYYSKNKN